MKGWKEEGRVMFGRGWLLESDVEMTSDNNNAFLNHIV